ncbi:uncharacterized protein LOC115192583 isoform X2 [Salmo trutta]|uniref:uncharacterized protein LOC115192583 isoform X2 n=1 Tax=Salmo trutta TaxID=8032 RepID=UPI001132454D|nr:uncharacterized protein LOC115192583 isoform X2 [Salmo trutta]
MDIWNKVINLLFLIALTATVTSALSAVITDPPQRTVEAPLGSSLTLNCSFEPQTSAWVRWYFNINQSCGDSRSSQLSSHKISVNKTVEQNDGGHFLQESGRAWSRLTVRDVWYNDSGWYFCWVQADIPYLRNSNSNGTQVIITGKMTESTPPLMTGLLLGWKLWVAVGAASAILVPLLVVIWILLQRRRSIIQRENPIYTNMPAIKQPSPRPGLQMDKQKISPTLKYLRTPTPARTHDNKHIRIPNPRRGNDNKPLTETPNPRRANDNKHLKISPPPRAHDNKPLTKISPPPRAHDNKPLTKISTPPRAHDNKPLTKITPPPRALNNKPLTKISTPPRALNNKPLTKTPYPPRAHDNKPLTETPYPPRAHDNKPLTKTPNPPRAHDGKHLPTPARAYDLRTPTPSRAHDSK